MAREIVLLPWTGILSTLVCSIILGFACSSGPPDRRSALADYYPMPDGCTGLTNRFLNTTAGECERLNSEEAALKNCVARRVGESCLVRNRQRQICALECIQDITHPDR